MPEQTLNAIAYTCVYIAAKVCTRHVNLCLVAAHPVNGACVAAMQVIEMVPYAKMLPWALTHVYNKEILPQQATELEITCLRLLNWRLGPFFSGPCA